MFPGMGPPLPLWATRSRDAENALQTYTKTSGIWQ